MHTREWALVAFTLLMQLSVGTVLVVAAVPLLAGRGAHPPGRAFDLSLLLAAVAAGLALVVSLFHLGRPEQAWLALINLRGSWLSREIVASVLFAAAAGAFVWQRRGGGDAGTAVVAAALMGIVVVYTMARLYMVPAQPAWDRVLTPLTFFVSALLLGTVFVLTTPIVAARLGPGAFAGPLMDPVVGRRLTFLAMSLLAAQGVLTLLYVLALPGEPAATISAASLGQAATWLAAARIATAIAALVLVRVLAIPAPGAPAAIPLAAIAFACVAASELLGRVLFYAGSVSMGPF